MGKFDGILICTDLDGTLMNSKKEISKENLDAIEYFKANGGLFTFITGRMPSTSKKTCELIKPNIAFGCINGGGVYDFEKQDFLWLITLPNEHIELLEYIDKKLPSVSIQISAEKHILFAKDNSAMEYFRNITGMPLLTCDYHNPGERVAKILFGEDNEEILMMVADLLDKHPLADKFKFVRSDKRFYEILPKGISKASAMNKIVELFELDPSKTIAIGDYDNDIAMIEAASVGVAVSNACDNLKKVADYITVSNDEHAIKKVIEDLEAGKITCPRTL